MLRKFAFVFFLLPVAIIIITLAVSNRQWVTVSVPPYIGDAPFAAVSLPLFALVFLSILLGMFIGSMATWMKQGKHRKEAKAKRVEATRWHFEAEKEKERANDLAEKVARQSTHSSGPGLPSPSKAA